MIKGLSDKLKDARKNIHISQKDVAARIGVSASVISNYESNERVPSLENIMSLATLYHVSSDYLLGLQPLDKDSSVDVSMLSPEQRQLLQSFLTSLK